MNQAVAMAAKPVTANAVVGAKPSSGFRPQVPGEAPVVCTAPTPAGRPPLVKTSGMMVPADVTHCTPTPEIAALPIWPLEVPLPLERPHQAPRPAATLPKFPLDARLQGATVVPLTLTPGPPLPTPMQTRWPPRPGLAVLKEKVV